MVYVQWGSFVLDREQCFRGREGINLLVHACHSMLSIFYSFFLILPFFSFHFSFSVFCLFLLWFSLRFLLLCSWFFFLFFPPRAWQGSLIRCLSWLDFTILAFNYLCLVWVYLPTITSSSVLAAPLPITRQRRLFCLFVCRDTLTYCGVSAFSLYPSWHARSGSNSSLLLLGGMSSQ